VKEKASLRFYPILHPDARLSATERQELAEGLARTFGLAFPSVEGGLNSERHDE
jgi:hypothetical protein